MQKNIFRQTLLAASLVVSGLIAIPATALAQEASAAAKNSTVQANKPSVVVLATGGGAVTIAVNHHFFKRGIIIYLRAEGDIQYERTCRDRNRPLLQIDNPKQKLTELFGKRDPIYQQLADITIVTGHNSPKKMVHDILLQLQDANITI